MAREPLIAPRPGWYEWTVSRFETAEAFGEALNAMETEGWWLHSWEPCLASWKEADMGETETSYTVVWFKRKV